MSKLESVRGKDFAQKVLQASQPVVVDFWASWCPPCKMMEPLLEKMVHKYSDTVAWFKVNVDHDRDLRDQFSINGVPTFILFRGGKEIARSVGAQSRIQLEQLIQKACVVG